MNASPEKILTPRDRGDASIRCRNKFEKYTQGPCRGCRSPGSEFGGCVAVRNVVTRVLRRYVARMGFAMPRVLVVSPKNWRLSRGRRVVRVNTYIYLLGYAGYLLN